MDKGTEIKLRRMAREIADEMATFLQQEYKFYEGRWWLFTLGKPARPLLPDEVEYAMERGLIPKENDANLRVSVSSV